MTVENWSVEVRRQPSGAVTVKGRTIGGAGPETVETCYTLSRLPTAGAAARVVAGLLCATPGKVVEVESGKTKTGESWRKLRVAVERG